MRQALTVRVFISGPANGLPDRNVSAFHAAGNALRAVGHVVVYPTHIDAPAKSDRLAHVRASLVQLVTCDAIYLLDGWERSEAARLEHAVAGVLHMGVIFGVHNALALEGI